MLRRRVQELEFSSYILQAQQDLSLDGILVVDLEWNIISHNQQFVSMWQIPEHIVTAKDDRASIQTVLDKVTSPDQFIARVEYLMRNPQETSREELELKDGRYFDRYSAPVYDKMKEVVGRVWFFSDITAMKQAQIYLKEQNSKLEQRVLQRTSDLEKKNAALKAREKECIAQQNELILKNNTVKLMLSALGEEKELIEERVTSNITGEVFPLVELLKSSCLSDHQQTIVETMTQILSNLTFSLTHSLKNNSLYLTPTEVQVANFIKAGRSTKEIATLLNSSYRTVEGHRLAIRKKMALKPRQNLRVILEQYR